MLSAEAGLELLLRRGCLGCVVLVLLTSACVFSQNGTLVARAEEQLEQFARALSPSTYQQAEVLYLRSKMKQTVGEHGEAMQLGEAAVRANPKSAAYRLQLSSLLSEEINHAGFFKRMSLARKVRVQLEAALKVEPNNSDGLFGMMIYYEQAPPMLGGSKEKAHRLADRIGRIDVSKGYLAEAQLARAEKGADEVEGLYLKAVDADPMSFDALSSLAKFYMSEVRKK